MSAPPWEDIDGQQIRDARQAEAARKVLDALSHFNVPRDDVSYEITGVAAGNQYTGGQDF